MKLVKAKLEDLRFEFHRGYKRGKLQAIIENFYDSEEDIMEVVSEPGEYSSINSFRGTIQKAVERSHLGVYVVSSNNKVYLLRKKV